MLKRFEFFKEIPEFRRRNIFATRFMEHRDTTLLFYCFTNVWSIMYVAVADIVFLRLQ